jgi:hypothetical protein
MDNKTHIQDGRSAAMENYVDFSGGTKKNWLNSYQEDALSSKDKQKYDFIKSGSQAAAWLLGLGVSYIVKKQGGSKGKQLGFGLATVAVGYGIAYLATKSYSDKLGASTGVSSNAMEAMDAKMKSEMAVLRREALSNYNYDYNYSDMA